MFVDNDSKQTEYRIKMITDISCQYWRTKINKKKHFDSFSFEYCIKITSACYEGDIQRLRLFHTKLSTKITQLLKIIL